MNKTDLSIMQIFICEKIGERKYVRKKWRQPITHVDSAVSILLAIFCKTSPAEPERQRVLEVLFFLPYPEKVQL